MNKSITIVEKGKVLKLELTEGDAFINEGHGRYTIISEQDDEDEMKPEDEPKDGENPEDKKTEGCKK